jgi:mycofactocin system FadH/OYE family oxidoreductase 1
MSLSSSLPIGSREAPSRVMFGPHETNLGIGRSFSAAHAAYYARRAAGGVGVIVLEEASVHPSDWPYERAPLAADCGVSWRMVGDSIRSACSHGAPPLVPVVLAGLGHSGGQGISHWSQRELWAPSAVPEVATREVPKVMEQSDIEAVVAGFASATRSAVSAGLDGVEINAGQFSLVRQFLSGLTNMRTDDYGADKLRFAREVLQAVRSAAGSSIVGLRLSIDELAPWAGIVPDAGVAIGVALAPFVDVLTIVRGSIYSSALTRPDGHVQPGFGIDLARQVRLGLRSAGLATPVFAQGSIVDVGQAEWALDSEAADGVEMSRALLADAELVNKVRADQHARIRPCILCNQTCKVRDNRNPIITCVVDPRTGFELTDAADPAEMVAANGKAIRIIGGGVAGMAAARTAALWGADVEIHERSSVFGGVVSVAANGAGRDRVQLIVDWLRDECELLGVRMHTDSQVDVDPAFVGTQIVATGGIAAPLPFEITADATVIWSGDVLNQNIGALPEGRVAVWDPIGGPIAISIAETLAASGRQVVLITPDLLVGEKLSLSGDLAPSQPRLHGAGIELVKRAIVRSVSASDVTVEDRFSGVKTVIPAVSFVACHHAVPDTAVDPDERLVHVGDRVAPRTILEAIREGSAAGRAAASS